MPLATSLFDYDLPARLIAQTPAARRDESRLLVVDRATRRLTHRKFSDIAEYLRPGDVLFRNNASVLPARLHARRPTGGQVECFLLRPETDAQTWRCLVKPGKKLPVGATFTGANGTFIGEIVGRDAAGSASVRFRTPNDEPITIVANRVGDVPLPPYINRVDSSLRPVDLERYQTVYAEKARQVAVAAPTAGLHFTPELLARIVASGVTTADITLHVGLGTFKPIMTDTVEAHDIHREVYEIPALALDLLAHPTGKRFAIGTTTVRTIEDYLEKQSGTNSDRTAQPALRSSMGASENPSEAGRSVPTLNTIVDEAGIFITPPYTFRGINALVTNFHQPRTTLLCLVAAFLAPGSTDGIAWVKEIYAEAIAREYRFFSYGDAMLIV